MLQVATNMNAMIGNWQVVLQINRELKKNSGGRRHRQGVKILRHNLCVFLRHVLALVPLFVSIFAEIQLPDACLPKRKDRR